MKLQTLILIVCCTIATSCKSSYTPELYKKEQLRFGFGGGFTGAIKEYCLLSSGLLFVKEERGQDFREIGKISKSKAKAYITEAHEIGVHHEKIQKAGNMYNFLTLKSPSGSNRVLWAEEASSETRIVPFQELHKKLTTLIINQI